MQAVFGDLIKTTECLRDTKKKVAELLEVGIPVESTRPLGFLDYICVTIILSQFLTEEIQVGAVKIKKNLSI